MRLEDSLLYLILDSTVESGVAIFCDAAIAGGVDVIHMPSAMACDEEIVNSVREVCRSADALFVISDDSGAVLDIEADGLHLSSATESVGQARAMIGADGLIGISTHTGNDAILGLEVGADYLLHWSGTGCPAAFAGLPGAAGSVLFAAGVESLEDARAVVGGGVYRLCVESRFLSDGDVTENAAAFSRVLGRSI